jgi:hypothetical protein
MIPDLNRDEEELLEEEEEEGVGTLFLLHSFLLKHSSNTDKN